MCCVVCCMFGIGGWRRRGERGDEKEEGRWRCEELKRENKLGRDLAFSLVEMNHCTIKNGYRFN